MNLKIIALSIGLVILIGGCANPTPGDAAYRGGHYEQAANLYRDGAKLGDSTAALKIGLMLCEKRINEKEYGQAIQWFTKACDLGNESGCHNAGNAYEYGKFGANKNHLKARKYYLISAEKGFMQSQYNLGSMYSNQHFDNDIEGLKWILIAKKSADTCSNVALCQWVKKDPPAHQNKLTSRMTKEQITSAQTQANVWRPKQ